MKEDEGLCILWYTYLVRRRTGLNWTNVSDAFTAFHRGAFTYFANYMQIYSNFEWLYFTHDLQLRCIFCILHSFILSRSSICVLSLETIGIPRLLSLWFCSFVKVQYATNAQYQIASSNFNFLFAVFLSDSNLYAGLFLVFIDFI